MEGNSMEKHRRLVICTIGIALLMTFIPPWQVREREQGRNPAERLIAAFGPEHAGGYSPILIPPGETEEYSNRVYVVKVARLDIGRLLFQYVLLALAAGVSCLIRLPRVKVNPPQAGGSWFERNCPTFRHPFRGSHGSTDYKRIAGSDQGVGGDALNTKDAADPQQTASVEPFRCGGNVDKHRLPIWVVTALSVVFLASPSSFADRIVKSDGRVLDGRIVAEDQNSVTIESSLSGMTIRQRILKNQLKSVEREVLEGPGYCPLPIVGGIGGDITADTLKRAIEAARQTHPDYIVLVFDSPGGQISEMVKIVQVIAETKDIKLIAYVRRAFSAAAVIASACPSVYMAPDAAIGAAVPFQVGPDNTPRAIEEKLQSAVRAQMRAAAVAGNHSELILRGMAEPDLQLILDKHSGKPVIREPADGELFSNTYVPNSTIPILIKRKGQILTLTAEEALNCGLSHATVASVDALKIPLGHKTWHMTSDQPWYILENRAKTIRWEKEKASQRNDQIARRDAYVKAIAPVLDEIQILLEKAVARHAAVADALNKLSREYADASTKLNAEYEAALARARLNGTADQMQRLQEMYTTAIMQLANHYKPQITALRVELDQAANEGELLVIRRTKLLKEIPEVDD
jgi:hypothetical protein